jgi:hypothetical protein
VPRQATQPPMIGQVVPDAKIVKGVWHTPTGACINEVWGPSSTERKLTQNRSLVRKNNSLRVMLTGVYAVGTAERR